jgi:phosphotransferase system enzyme I (PtsI)
MIELKGISASPGIVIGKAFLYIDENPSVPKYDINTSHIEGELERLQEALDKATLEIELLKKRTEAGVSPENINFLDSHLLMLQDPEFKETVKKDLSEKLKNVEWVLHQTIQSLIEKLNSADDP